MCYRTTFDGMLMSVPFLRRFLSHWESSFSNWPKAYQETRLANQHDSGNHRPHLPRAEIYKCTPQHLFLGGGAEALFMDSGDRTHVLVLTEQLLPG